MNNNIPEKAQGKFNLEIPRKLIRVIVCEGYTKLSTIRKIAFDHTL